MDYELLQLEDRRLCDSVSFFAFATWRGCIGDTMAKKGMVSMKDRIVAGACDPQM